jgi:transcriptional regulator NrdR family protein
MICPNCKSNRFKVKYKLNVPKKNSIIRRRECLVCESRFTTCEKIIPLSLINAVKINEKRAATKSS